MDQVKMGQLIAQLRKEMGFTQQQLAEQLNLSNKTISKWESGAGAPDLANLAPLAKVLGVTVDELLQGEKCLGQKAAKEHSRDDANRQKRERAVIALAASLGAVLGIIAYHQGWLG